MVYVLQKHDKGFTLMNNTGDKREFADKAAVVEFLAGWALSDMKPGDHKYITDVEVVHSHIG